MSSQSDEFYDAKSEISEPLSPIILSHKGSPIKNNEELPTIEDVEIEHKSIPSRTSRSSSQVSQVSPVKSEKSEKSLSSPIKASSTPGKSPSKSAKSPMSPIRKELENTLETEVTNDESGQTIQFKNEQPQEDLIEEDEGENGMHNDLAKEFESLMQQRQEEEGQNEEIEEKEELKFTGEKLESQEDVQIAPLSFGLLKKPVVEEDDDFDDFEAAPETNDNADDFEEFQSNIKEVEPPSAVESISDKDQQLLLEFKNNSSDLLSYLTADLEINKNDIYDTSEKDIGKFSTISTPYGPRHILEPSLYLVDLKEYKQLDGILEKDYELKEQTPFVWQRSHLRKKLLQIAGLPLNLDEFYTNPQKRKFGPLSEAEVLIIESLLKEIEHYSTSDLESKKLEELGTLQLSIEKSLGRLKDGIDYYTQENKKCRDNIEISNREIKNVLLEAQSKKKQTTKKKYFY